MPKTGFPPSDEGPDRLDAAGERGRVARAVREEVAVEAEELLRARRRGEDRHVEALRGELPEDVPLDPVVDGGDARPRGAVHAPAVRDLRTDLEREGGARHPRLLEDEREEPRPARLVDELGRDGPAHRSERAEVPHERAGVEAVDRDRPRLPESLAQPRLSPRVREALGEVARGEARDLDPLRLGVFSRDSGVPDVRGGHDDDLPAVRGIGERLLVPGHRRVEDDLAEGRPRGAEGSALEGAAVLQDEDRGDLRHSVRPTAAAIGARRAIRAENIGGVSACGPSERASSGWWWTSTATPSAPAAIDASDIGMTLSRRPVP